MIVRHFETWVRGDSFSVWRGPLIQLIVLQNGGSGESWQWTARGGYGSQGNGDTNGRDNSTKERIWFSPHCVGVEKEAMLF